MDLFNLLTLVVACASAFVAYNTYLSQKKNNDNQLFWTKVNLFFQVFDNVSLKPKIFDFELKKKIEHVFCGNEVFIYLLGIYQFPYEHATITKGINNEWRKLDLSSRFKEANLHVFHLFISKIDRLVKIAMDLLEDDNLIDEFNKDKDINKLKKFVNINPSFKYRNISSFKSLISNEFKLIVLLQYINNRENKLYERFLLPENYGFDSFDEINYFFSWNKDLIADTKDGHDEFEYHQFLKE